MYIINMSMAHALTHKILPKRPLCIQILFTIFAFFLMVVLSYNFMGKTMRANLVNDVEGVFNTLENQIKFDLLEPETML